MTEARRIEYIRFCNDQRHLDPPSLPEPESPRALRETYHRYDVLMAHWDRKANPGLLAVLRVFEGIIRRLEAQYQRAIDVWLRS